MKYKKLITSTFVLGALLSPVISDTVVLHAKEVSCAKEQQAFNAIKQNREEIEDTINRLVNNISTYRENIRLSEAQIDNLTSYIADRGKELKEYQDYLDYLNSLPEADKGSDWERSRGAAMRTIERLGDHIKTAEGRIVTLKANIKVTQDEIDTTTSKLGIQRNNLEYAISEYDRLNQELILCLNKPGDVPNKHHWENLPKQGNDIPMSNGGKHNHERNSRDDDRSNKTGDRATVIRYSIQTPGYGVNEDVVNTGFSTTYKDVKSESREGVYSARQNDHVYIPAPPKIQDVALPSTGTDTRKLIPVTVGTGVFALVLSMFLGRKNKKD